MPRSGPAASYGNSFSHWELIQFQIWLDQRCEENQNMSLWSIPLWHKAILNWKQWRSSKPRKSSPFSAGSVQLLSHSVMSDSLQPHGLQHTRPPCPSRTPGVYSNSCPSSQWCHPAISSSVIPFSSCPLSLPASGSFPMSQLFEWGGHKYWSFSFSISLSNEHPGLISFRMD